MHLRRFSMRSVALVGAVMTSLVMASAELPASSPVHEPTRSFTYRMTLGGAEMAVLKLKITCDQLMRRLALQMRNTGITAWISQIRTEMRSTVNAVNGTALPVVFTARYRKPDRKREIRLEYDAQGALLSVSLVKNGRPKQSDVPPELQQGTVDPLTAYVRLQDWLRAPRKEGDRITLGVFEGRKRLDLEAVYVGRETVSFRGREVPGHRLRVRLTGLFGFDGGFGFVGRPEEPPNWLDVRTTDGDFPVLVRAAGRSSSLAPVVELQ